jgi:DNA-directed RNA polymerase beta subunit
VRIFFEKILFKKYSKHSQIHSYKIKPFEKNKKEKWNQVFPGYEFLDNRGLVTVGTWVEPGQILALRVRPIESRRLTPYENLLFDILEQEQPSIQSVPLLVPDGIKGRILNVETFPNYINSTSTLSSSRKKYWNDLLNPTPYILEKTNLSRIITKPKKQKKNQRP